MKYFTFYKLHRFEFDDSISDIDWGSVMKLLDNHDSLAAMRLIERSIDVNKESVEDDLRTVAEGRHAG